MRRFVNAAAFFGGLRRSSGSCFMMLISWSPVLVPSPVSVAELQSASPEDGATAGTTLITMRRLLIGYVIGIIGGLPLGLLTARWNMLRDTVEPWPTVCRPSRVSAGSPWPFSGSGKRRPRCCSSL